MRHPGGATPSLKVVGRLPGTHGLKSLWAPKKGVKILCVAAELKNRGQKSICGHKKGGQYSMSHWKIGVKILCSKSWEGQNFMKAKIWGSKLYFSRGTLGQNSMFPEKGGQNSIFFPSALKKGGQNRGAYQPTSLKGCPPRDETWLPIGWHHCFCDWLVYL